MARGKASRRALGWACFAVLLSQLVLGVVTDQIAVPVRDPEFACRESQLRALRAMYPDRKVVVLLGTSRTMLGINACRLTQSGTNLCYNFGMPAAGPTRQLLTWRRLVASGLKPDAVAIEILPALHTHDGQKLFESRWSDPSRLSFDEMRQLVPSYAQPMRGAIRWGVSRLAPFVRYSPTTYRQYLASGEAYVAPSSEGIPSDEFGWRQGFSIHGWEDSHREKATRMLLRQYRRACEDPRPAPGEPMLEVLLDELCTAGVPAVVFTMPESSAFHLQAMKVEPAVSRVKAACQQHEVPFVDLRREMPDEAFYDGHHLHPETADAFTVKFAQKVLAETPHGYPGWAFNPSTQVVSSH